MVTLRSTVLLWLVLAGCSATRRDPIIGKWEAGDKTFEFTGEGAVVGPARSEPICREDKDALAACAQRNYWKRDGSTYQIAFMTLAPPRSPGLGELLASENDASGCDCVEDIRVRAEVIGDELVIEGGKERARRVK